jgi:hypothetical protein
MSSQEARREELRPQSLRQLLRNLRKPLRLRLHLWSLRLLLLNLCLKSQDLPQYPNNIILFWCSFFFFFCREIIHITINIWIDQLNTPKTDEDLLDEDEADAAGESKVRFLILFLFSDPLYIYPANRGT